MGQNINLHLKQSGFKSFNHHIYCFGLNTLNVKNQILIYQLDEHLKINDSIVIDQFQTSKEGYLNLHADTLHNFLNVYVQEKNTKLVNIIRIDKLFKVKTVLKNIDVARINNVAVIGNNTLFYKDNVYAIKSAFDSTGLQYYLNKYKLKSDLENFDYVLNWQYPFEKKDIQNIQLLCADTNQVFMIVHIYKGAKAGEWFLAIDSKTGKLKKVMRLSEKSENVHLMPGSFLFQSGDNSTLLLGQKLLQTQFDPLIQKLSVAGATSANLYLITIDSLNAIISKQDIKIPINDIQQGTKKTNAGYYLKTSTIKKLNSGRINIEIDVFKTEQNSLCFYYTNTQIFTLGFDGEKYVLEKNSIVSNFEVENYYRTKDKLNNCGKICLDSVSDLNKLYLKTMLSPVKKDFRTDDYLNGYWLLTKTDINKQVTNYSVLAPINKIYALKSLENTSTNSEEQFDHFTNSSFLLGNQLDENNFQLKLIHW